MALADLAKRHTTKDRELDVIEFATSQQGLNMQVLPAQRMMLKLFNKVKLDTRIKDIEIRDKFNEVILHTLTEREFYQYLEDQGRISLSHDKFYESDIIQYLLCCGRRGTKTTALCIQSAYTLYRVLRHFNPQAFFGVPTTSNLNISIVALGQSNASKIFSKLATLLNGSPFFRVHSLADAVKESTALWTKHDIDKTLKGRVRNPPAHSNSIDIAAMPNSPGVRGDDNIIAWMDELAHYNYSSAKSTTQEPLDSGIYNAITPSVSGFLNPDGSAFGRCYLSSSPRDESGKFYEEFQHSFELGAESGCLTIQAPTWELNPNVSPTFLKTQYRKDPQMFRREYGAEFTSGGDNWIEDLGCFYRVFDKRLQAKTWMGRSDSVYFLGSDFGLSYDGTAMAISHFDPKYEESGDSIYKEAYAYDAQLAELFKELGTISGGRYVIDYVEARYPGEAPYENRKVLFIEELLDWVAELYLRWPIKFGIFDQWSGEIIQQIAKSKGLKRFQMLKHTREINNMQYTTFSQLLHGNMLKMPRADAGAGVVALESELLSLQSEHVGHDMIKIEAGSGGHDDRFDAIVRSLFLTYAYVNGISQVQKFLPDLFKKVQLIKHSANISRARSLSQIQYLRSKMRKQSSRRGR